ncbi:MAG: WD40 repeat domain-containing protein [Kofleriaceae bacterium]
MLTPTSRLAPGETGSRRISLGVPQAVAWNGDELVIGTSAGAYIWDLASGGVRQIHVGNVVAIAASGGELFLVDANRSSLVIAGSDGAVRLRVSFEQEQGRLECGALSPDGTRFVVGLGAEASSLVAVDTHTGAQVFRAVHGGKHCFEGFPSCVAFSADGVLVATGNSHEEKVWIWDAHTGAPLGEWHSEKAVTALAFSDHGIIGTTVFGGGLVDRSDRFLRVYDVKTGTVKQAVDTPDADDDRGEPLLALALSPDHALVAAGGEDGAVHVFDASWNVVVRIDAMQLAAVESRLVIEVAALAFSPDGRQLAVAIARNANLGSGENEYLVEVWDTKDWSRTHLLDDFVGVTRSPSPLPDGRLCVATDEGLRVYSSDLGSYEIVVTDNVGSAALSPDGARAILGAQSFEGEAQVVELEDGTVVTELTTTRERVDGVAYGDNDLVAVAHAGVWIFRLGRKTVLKRLTSHRNRVVGCAARGTVFAFASWDGTVSWLDAATKSAGVMGLAPPGPRRRLSAVAFSPDGTQLAVAASLPLDDKSGVDGGVVWIVDLDDKSWTALHPTTTATTGDSDHVLEQRVREAPDDLASRGVYADWLEQRGDTSLAAFVRDGSVPSTPEGRIFESVTWSPDGVIAAGDRNGVLCRWDSTSHQLLGMTVAHGGWITALASGHGRLYSASEDGTVGVWLPK